MKTASSNGFYLPKDSAVAHVALGDDSAALDSLKLAEQLGGYEGVTLLVWLAYGYGLLGQPDDAQRAFDALEALSEVEYVDPPQWAWAYMGVGDYDEALRLLNSAIANPELIRRTFVAYIWLNIWQDAMLEEPAFVDVRNRLASIYQ